MADVCPYDAISYTRVDAGFTDVARVDPDVCEGCDALCVAVCDEDAFPLIPRKSALADAVIAALPRGEAAAETRVAWRDPDAHPRPLPRRTGDREANPTFPLGVRPRIR